MRSMLILCALLAGTTAFAQKSIHSRGQDIQVLEAKYIGTWGSENDMINKGTLPVDFSRCQKLGSSRNRTRALYKFDCSQSVAQKWAKMTGQPVTFLGNLIFTAEAHPAFGWQSLTGICDAVAIRAVLKESAMMSGSFIGAGFYLSNQGVRIKSRDSLAPLQRVQLKDGEPAHIVNFITFANCYHSNDRSSFIERRIEFKPFSLEQIRYHYGDLVNRYMWDAVQNNYLLGCTLDGKGFISEFTRRQELLKETRRR